MPYLIFDADYDHVWPSRAQTAFKRGHRGRVKKEVADAAIAAGKAREAKPDDEAPPKEPTLPGNLPADLAVPDALTPNRGVADGPDS